MIDSLLLISQYSNSPIEILQNNSLYRMHICFKQLPLHCTAGHEGAVGDLSCMSIFSACFGLPTTVQLPATTWSGQIWISCWILPHFDVRTISVAWKLKKLSNIFWQKIFFLLHPLSKGVAPLCNVLQPPARPCHRHGFWQNWNMSSE